MEDSLNCSIRSEVAKADRRGELEVPLLLFVLYTIKAFLKFTKLQPISSAYEMANVCSIVVCMVILEVEILQHNRVVLS